jgi:transcriptional regulator with XRE-family HTH domain
MKLGDVLRKERERKKLTLEDAASALDLSTGDYQEIEAGATQFEEWGPMLAEIAIKLSVPTSRLISETGKFAQASQREGQCGHLVTRHRERRAMSQEELGNRVGWHVDRIALIEAGKTPIEIYGPLLLRFSEMVDQPIFNLFYPCGLPYAELKDYP